MNTVVIALGLLNAICLVAVMLLVLNVVHIRKSLLRQDISLERMQDDLNAMCCGAVGFGRQLTELDQQSQRISKRQDQLDLKEPTQTTYKYALKMARDGAHLEDVIQDCGIAEGEAELVLLASRM